MRTLLRDLSRQPWRTTLTVAGIAIGIFALVVFGSLAEHFRAIVAESKEYVKGTVRIATKTNKDGETPGVTEEDLAAARSVPGVKAIATTITLLFDGFHLDDNPLLFLDPKPLVEGLPPEYAKAMRPGVHLVSGRWLKKGDRKKAMVVEWLVKKRGYEIGKTVQVRHRDYELVGVFEAPDIAIVPAGLVPFEDLREGMENPGLAHARKFFTKKRTSDEDPGLTGVALDAMGKLAEQFVSAQEERWYPHEVIPDDPDKAEELAKALKEKLPQVAVIEPAKLAESMEKAVAIFLAITAVVSAISSIVGGLLIVNTMAMAVVERRREVSIKVAIGASPAQVVLEFVLEAALMGLAGALIGTVAGCVTVLLVDPWMVSQVDVGASFFKITPSLIAGVVGYGVGLGVIAGFAPALRAARVDPAQGLREL